MSNFNDIEKRRPNWGKREWLNFARLQTQDLDNAKAEIKGLDADIISFEEEMTEQDQLIERLTAGLKAIAGHNLPEPELDWAQEMVDIARKALNPYD